MDPSGGPHLEPSGRATQTARRSPLEIGPQHGPRMGPGWVQKGSKTGDFRGRDPSGPRKDTVKRSKGDSIDGQIMLFPITRAREGIYKDPRRGVQIPTASTHLRGVWEGPRPGQALFGV